MGRGVRSHLLRKHIHLIPFPIKLKPHNLKLHFIFHNFLYFGRFLQEPCITCIMGMGIKLSFVLQGQAGNKMPEKVMKWLVCSRKDVGSSRNASPRLESSSLVCLKVISTDAVVAVWIISGMWWGTALCSELAGKILGWSWGARKSNSTHLRLLSKERINPHGEPAYQWVN